MERRPRRSRGEAVAPDGDVEPPGRGALHEIQVALLPQSRLRGWGHNQLRTAQSGLTPSATASLRHTGFMLYKWWSETFTGLGA